MARRGIGGVVMALVLGGGSYLLITNWRKLFPPSKSPSIGPIPTPGEGNTPPPSDRAMPPPSGGTTPPTGGDKAFLQAIDTNGNGIIDDDEMIKANVAWTSGQAPFNVGAVEGDRLIRLVTQYWVQRVSYR